MIRSFQFFIGGGSIAKACFNLTGFFMQSLTML